MKAHARAADSGPTSGCRRQMPPHFENVLSVASRERFLWSQAGGGGIFVSWESLKGPGDERRQLSLFAGHISISATQDRPHREHDFPFGKRSCSAVRAYVGPCQPLANAQRPAHLKQVFVFPSFLGQSLRQSTKPGKRQLRIRATGDYPQASPKSAIAMVSPVSLGRSIRRVPSVVVWLDDPARCRHRALSNLAPPLVRAVAIIASSSRG